MPKYRTKPATIEAMIFTDEPAKLLELGEFVDNGADGWMTISYADRNNPQLIIKTPDGDVRASVGDYLIKFDDGRVYPMSAESFHENYEAVE